MNNSNLPNRIKSYLDGTMSAREAQRFEADLETDFELKKAFVAYSINAHKPQSPNLQKSKELVDSIFNALPPFPKPTLPLLFRLKMWFQPLQYKLIAAAGLLVFATWAIIHLQTPNFNKAIADNAIPATCKSVAGESLTPRQIFERASGIYCGHETEDGALEKLLQLSAVQDSFCMADYYIAHWYLKNHRYADAVPMFEACLSARKIIEANQETEESYNAILLNTILARFGADQNVAAALSSLNDLSASINPNTKVARNIAHFKSVLAKQ